MTTFWPRVRAQRAFCEAEIFARAATLILRGPRGPPALSNPLSAPIAVSRAINCPAILSLSAFNSAIMSMSPPLRGIVAELICRACRLQSDSCGSGGRRVYTALADFARENFFKAPFMVDRERGSQSKLPDVQFGFALLSARLLEIY
jgi:hypothetical protein